MSEDGTVRLSVRKEKKDASEELLSDYPDVRTVIASERTAEIGGYGDRFAAAAFRENGFTYTIEFSPGISREEAAGVIGKIH